MCWIVQFQAADGHWWDYAGFEAKQEADDWASDLKREHRIVEKDENEAFQDEAR